MKHINLKVQTVALLGATLLSIPTYAEMAGHVTVIDKGNVKIHSYVSPPKGGTVNTQIIETPHSLVLVDAQMAMPFAKEVRAYADSLGKKIDRIIISHPHPDHWFGLEAFEGVPVYALAGTQKVIAKSGEKTIARMSKKLGKASPTKVVIPQHIIKAGSETIDGVTFNFEEIKDAEAGIQLLTKIPSIKTVIGQDLFYSDLHAFTGNNTFDGWVSTLQKLKADGGYDTLLVGHGKPATPELYDELIPYLQNAKKALAKSKTGEEYKAMLTVTYPDLKGAGMIDVSNHYLFKKAH
jgi:glyoxylase-like metal-dependent hydrolase (beta-lactamase superfamily II)